MYNKVLSIYISSSSQFQKRKVALTVTATFQPSSVAGVSCGSKDFVVQLTCEDNPLFLYSVRIGESDFQRLKSDQNLLVDFSGFPKMFVDLLESVLSEEGKAEPKFLIYFSEESAKLSDPTESSGESLGSFEIVESNKFKHLVHLALKLKSASDAQLKKHLADCLSSVKRTLSTTETQSKQREIELKRKAHQLSENLSQKTVECEKTKQLWQEEVQKLSEQHAQSLANCQERLSQDQESIRDDYKRLTGRVDHLETENQRLKEELESCQVNVDRLKARNDDLQDECQQWQDRYSDIERELDEIPVLRRQVENLDEMLREKEDEIGRAREKFRNLVSTKGRLEKALQAATDDLEEQKSETEKAVDVVRKLMDKNRLVRDKAKHNGEVLVGQEKHVKALEEECEKAKSQWEACQNEKDALRQEKEKLSKELKEMGDIAAANQKTIQSKDSLIDILNRQLRELKVSVSPTAGFSAAKQTPFVPSGPLSYRPVLGFSQSSSNRTSTPENSNPSTRFSKFHPVSVAVGISPISSSNNDENVNPSQRKFGESFGGHLEPNLP